MRTSPLLWRQPAPLILRQLTTLRQTLLKRRRRARTLFILMILAVLSAVATAFVVGLPVAIACVLLAVGLAVAAIRSGPLPDADSRIRLASRLVRTLAADIPPKVPTALKIDLRPYRKGGRRLPARSGAARGTARYVQEWLSLEASLADGSLLRIFLIEYIRRKEKSKRKYTRVNERIFGRIALSVRLHKAAGSPQAIRTALSSSAVPSGLTLRKVAVQGRRLLALLDTDGTRYIQGRSSTRAEGEELFRSPDSALEALVWLYQGIGAAGRAAPPARPAHA